MKKTLLKNIWAVVGEGLLIITLLVLLAPAINIAGESTIPSGLSIYQYAFSLSGTPLFWCLGLLIVLIIVEAIGLASTLLNIFIDTNKLKFLHAFSFAGALISAILFFFVCGMVGLQTQAKAGTISLGIGSILAMVFLFLSALCFFTFLAHSYGFNVIALPIVLFIVLFFCFFVNFVNPIGGLTFSVFDFAFGMNGVELAPGALVVVLLYFVLIVCGFINIIFSRQKRLGLITNFGCGTLGVVLGVIYFCVPSMVGAQQAIQSDLGPASVALGIVLILVGIVYFVSGYLSFRNNKTSKESYQN